MTPKKILILDTGKEWGGGTNSLLELLSRVDKRQYAFTALFYNNYGKGSSSDIKTEMEKLGVRFIILDPSLPGPRTKALKEVIRAVFFISPGLKKKYLFYLDFNRRIAPNAARIASVIKDNGYDLLYMNNQPSSNLEGIMAAHSADIPCLQHARIEVGLNKIEAETVNRLVAKVICVSSGVRDGLVNSGVKPSKCAIVHNGIDGAARPSRQRNEVRRELGLSDDAIIIGTAGSLVKRKRVNLLLEAAAALKETACVVVGDGPERDSLVREAARLGITERTRFTGFSTDVLSYINAMDVFVLPSEKEGLPRVILEAMLMAKPVIAFNVAGANELILDNQTGRLLRDARAGSIADVVAGMISDRARMITMGEAARERVRAEFGIDRYVSGVCRVFDETLLTNADA